jgi:hypothetical protein
MEKLMHNMPERNPAPADQLPPISQARLAVVAALAATLPEMTVDELVAGGDLWHQPPYAPTEIVPGLYQGGTEDHDVLSRGGHDFRLRGTYPFDTVITLYASAQPVPWGVEELRFGFLDSTLGIGEACTVIRAARFAFTRWLDGADVLIRCQAGMNRSGLVTALTLTMAGMTPAQAISQIRLQRGPGCLFNEHFVHWLVTQNSAVADPSIARRAGPVNAPA